MSLLLESEHHVSNFPSHVPHILHHKAILNTCKHKHTLLTLHSQVDSLCSNASFVYSNALVPA